MTFLFLQFLPIVVFVVVDSVIDNTVISIISAVLFTAVQAVITWHASGRFDYFLLADLAIIAVMGGVSIATNDDRFFKVKPAIIEALCVPFLLFFVFASDRFIINYFGRYMPPGRKLADAALPLLKRMLLIMTVYIAFHVMAIIYTAEHSSRTMWAFVSGPGFYFVLIPIMAYMAMERYRRSRAVKRQGE
ncbi:MAG TPA: septation protein IspZ [Spirochaetota bacterium]|nr:septation protein IspZ [Spirochaetota bacterium]